MWDMKQISARAFRVSFPTLSEPVTVIRRDKGGNYQVLGTWTPLSGGAEPATSLFATSEALRRSSRFGRPKAAPKP